MIRFLLALPVLSPLIPHPRHLRNLFNSHSMCIPCTFPLLLLNSLPYLAQLQNPTLSDLSKHLHLEPKNVFNIVFTDDKNPSTAHKLVEQIRLQIALAGLPQWIDRRPTD